MVATKNKENNEKKQHLKEENSCEKANDTKTDMKNCENEQRVFETKKKAYKFFNNMIVKKKIIKRRTVWKRKKIFLWL